MKYPILLAALVLLCACAGGANPSADQTARLLEARRLLVAADPDGALQITDQLLKDQPHWRDARMLAADGYLQLARVDRPHARKDLLLTDAVHNYEQALAIDGGDGTAWLHLSDAYLQLGRFDDAKHAGEMAVQQFSANKAGDTAIAGALLAMARAGLQLFIAARQREIADGTREQDGFVKPSPATTALAAAMIGRLALIQGEQPEAFRLSATAYQWLGQIDGARQELERGIRNHPTDAELHLAYQDLHRQIGDYRALVGAYTRLSREHAGVPVLQWFQGRAQVMLGNEQRSKGNFQGAIDAYCKAVECYGQYKAMMPAFADSAAQQLGIGELSIAATCADMGDLQSAKEHLFLADQASTAVVQYDGNVPALTDAFGRHYAGVVFAISRALAQAADQPLQKTLAFNEELIQRHPDQWGFVYNNAALPARDLGVQIRSQVGEDASAELKAAAQQQAMALWERSYRYYEAAARLSPDDPRILNDTGLMLIYHLNRDLDRAKALFEQAIKVGQPQLDALPKDSDQDTRNFLEEAIGDAWQNLAVLMVRHLHRPFAEYQQYCEKAVTYYPYQQRAAAFMLKNDGVEPEANGQRPRRRGGPRLDADDAALPAEELLQQGQGDAKETFARAKAAAEPKARDGDLDGALQVLDGVASELKQFAPFQALKGDYLLQYANQQRDQGKRSVELLYEDACAALHKAVELDSEPLGPRQLLAQAQYEKGDFDAALRTASALLLHAQSLGGVEAGLGTATHKVRAQAGSHLLAGRQGGGKDQTLLLADVRTSFRHLEQKHQLDIALRQAWAAAEQWAGAPVEAVKVFARGLIDQPDDQALLAALVDTAATMGQSPIAVEALKSRTDAAGIWYRGRAEYGAALELQIAGKNTEAAPAIDKAQQCFKQSMAANREFADSAEQWQALCLGKKGNLALAMNHLEDAEQLLLAAARLRPQLVGQDLGMLETTKSGLVKVADKYFRQQDLASTERIYRAAADAAPEDLDLLNNAGLFARDLGNELQRAGKQPQARAMFEQSYQVYARAAQLDPGNVRLRNDTALILVHHLERDWDRARELLESAIADGDRTLKNAPPDDQQQRQDLDEAVGDCWENLALLHIKHGKDLAAARQACTASLLHYPKAQRDGVRRHLATIERLEQQGK